MKEFRPLILWLLILGIVFAVWNNFSSRQAQKKQIPAQLQTTQPKQQVSPAAQQPRYPDEPVDVTSQKEVLVGAGLKPAPTYLKEFGILAGFAKGNLKEKSDYEFIPVIFRFGFDLNRLLRNQRPKQLFEFELEPFVSAVINPDTNAEFGSNFLFKLGYFFTKKLCPYVEAGAGILYITQHTREQSTQFNFIPQAGAGISYFLRDNLSINAGYRYRHLSNGSIDHPNKGINVDMIIVGISWYF